MGTIHRRDSVIKNVLKNLCCCYGWSYGVFWSFDQQNAIFLTMQDAYFDEEFRGLIESLCPQVHMLGGGIIGQVAFTKNHQWMCLENHNTQQSSSNSISDVFLDDYEFDCQFSCGIKTIAAIPVEPQGVVQFGSTEKIIETVEFVNQTKIMFQETMNHGMFEDPWVTDGVHGSMGPTCLLACPTQPCLLSSNSQPILPDHNQWLQPNNESGGLESWNTFPTRSNSHDLFDSLQDFGIPDDFYISQWIQEPNSMNLEEKGGNFIVNESQLDFHYQKSKSKSNNQVGVDSITPCSTKGLFSKLRIDELLEGISGTSHAVSSTFNGYGRNRLSTFSQAKNHVEPPKATKKKAKPGTRPRPKDRQQILDRMAELRELIPNGNKMSIDSLLDRTVKHMVFLQSVTKHADRIKQADEPKKSKGNDATWAYELGNQTMACPLIVEDLSTPGQMLIEMLCEERGFFLEMVDIIKGFGVIILKGVMEIRDKIWAHFIVEAEAKRRVTRHEIFSALVQFLQVTHLDDNHVCNTIMEEKTRLLRGYVQVPISLAETDYCIDL